MDGEHLNSNKSDASESIQQPLAKENSEEEKVVEWSVDSLDSNEGKVPVLPQLSSIVVAFVKLIQDISPAQRQVKYFVNLKGSENWVEKGIGTFRAEIGSDEVIWFAVAAIGAVDELCLVKFRVDLNTRYSFQGNAILTWLDSFTPSCLSFSCHDTFRQVGNLLQQLVPGQIILEDEFDEEDEPDEENMTDVSHLKSLGQTGRPFIKYLEDFEDLRAVDPVLLERCTDNSLTRISPVLSQRPRSIRNLNNCAASLRVLERCAVTKPVIAGQLLRKLTSPSWLNALWGLLHENIQTEQYSNCGLVAEVLCRIVSVYAVTSSPFTKLATAPGCPAVLDPTDPLVYLLSDIHYENFFGALEFEPELCKHSIRFEHVEFLRSSTQFREVICEDNPAFRITCHFIYRVLYLRDVCLPRHLDEFTIQVHMHIHLIKKQRLSGLINSGYAYLCRLIHQTPGAIRTLKQMIPVDISAARFVLQLLSVLRSNVSAVEEKAVLFGALKHEGLLEALEGYLTGDCRAARDFRKLEREKRRMVRETEDKMTTLIKSDTERQHRPQLLSHDRMSLPTLEEIAMEILHLVVEYNPGVLRVVLLNQASRYKESPPPLWDALCRVFKSSHNEGLHSQLSEIFRRLLDPSSMESPEADDFLSVFYDRGVIDRLIEILLKPPPLKFEELLPSAFEAPYYVDTSIDESDDESVNCEDEEPSTETPTCPTTFRRSTLLTTPCRKLSADLNSTNTADGEPSSEGAIAESGSSETTCSERDTSPTASTPVRRELDNINPPPAKRRASASAESHLPVARRVSLSGQTRGLSRSHSVPGSSRSSLSPKRVASTDTMIEAHLPDPAEPTEAPATAILSKRQTKLRAALESLSPSARAAVLVASRSQLSFVKCQISEILAFCVAKHNFRIKYRTLQQSLHVQLIHMSFDPIFDQFLAMHAVKFLRACITSQADYFSRIFIRHDIFHPLLFLLRYRVTPPQGRAEGSVLESVIFDFFSTIRTLAPSSAPIAALLQHLFEKHEEEVNLLSSYYQSHCNFNLFEQLRSINESNIQQMNKRQTPRKSFLIASEDGDRFLSPRPMSDYRDVAEYEQSMQDAYFELGEDEDNHGPMEGENECWTSLLPTNGFKELPRLVASSGQIDEEDDSDVPEFLKVKVPTTRNDSSNSVSMPQTYSATTTNHI